MTYRERYILEGGKDADKIHITKCPEELVQGKDVFKCISNCCRKCWDSTIPGTEDEEENKNGK